MKKLAGLIPVAIILPAALFISSCNPGGAESVLIQGAVTIGPLTPVQQAGVCPTAAPEVFSSRHLVIYDESGKKLVREVYFTQIGNTANGYYTAQIAPGTYTVDLASNGIEHAAGLPKKITVTADETVTIDVDIDTGIR
jgi:hypothetical protein